MKKLCINIIKYLASVLVMLSFAACNNDEPNDSPFVDPKHPSESTILIYAVATNSLDYNLVYDKKEMLEAAKKIDLNKNNVLIYQTLYTIEDGRFNTSKSETQLVKLVKRNNNYEWQTIKEYDEGVASLNPSRISEVIDFILDKFSAKSYGLVFWSHSLASQPYVYTKSTNVPLEYSFGSDLLAPTQYRQINVDDLADAIPDNVFNFIWFDSCLMSNIETIYQFRNKCNYFVSYPTEVLDDGMPYHLTLPYMIGSVPSLVEASETFFNYYKNSFATIATIDMSQIEVLANYCKSIYTSGISIPVASLMRYSRGSMDHFYDLGDYSKAMAESAGYTLPEGEWEEVLDRVMLYKNTTYGNLLGLRIYPERYSGISTHVYEFDNISDNEPYYQSLDWYKRVFE